MRILERSTAALVAVVMVAIGLVACTSEQETPAPSTGTPPAAEPQAMPEPAPAPAMPTGELPPGVTAEMVAQGQQIFTTTTCQTCHGPDGGGTALAPNLRDNQWLNIQQGSYEEIQNVVRNGVPQPVQFQAPMPPMGGAQLSDEQIRAVAAYVYSISRS